jgi:uncharacterized protein
MATSKDRLDKQEALARADGWSNVITNIGTSQDKRMYNKIDWNPQSPEFFEQLYAGDELASRIVNIVPEEALRQGWEWTGGPEKQIIKKINDRAAELDLRGAIERTWKWGRAYGGACLYIVTDTRDPASPLRKGERVIGLRDLSRYDLRILSTDVEADFGSSNWGHPNIYYLTVQMGSQFKGYPIHWTRMVRFDGYLVPRRTYIRNNYWHDSVLNRIYNVIRNYQSANDAVATMLQDFNVDIYKMKDVANLISAGKEDLVKKRIEIMNFSKSVIRAMILDSDSEEYENGQRSIEGVSELLTQQANRLVAAVDMPHTVLLGESPDGSNATGNSTTNQWYNKIQAEQENYLRPKLKRLMQAIFYDIEDLDFKFNPLHHNTEGEEADIRLKVAQADQIYLTNGVLDPTELADSRFGGDEYSMETQLNKDAREQGLLTPHASDAGFDPNGPDGEDPDGTGGATGEEDPIDSAPQGANGLLKPGQSAASNLPVKGKPSTDAEAFPVAESTEEPEGQDMVGTPIPQPIKKSPKVPLNQAGGPDATPPESEEEEEEPTDLPESLQPYQGNEVGFGSDDNDATYGLKNQSIGTPVEKVKQMIGISMSEPMRDPKTDPKLPPPGRTKNPRVINPTVGDGVVSKSGAQFRSDTMIEDAFTEGKHPRAGDGKFGHGAGKSAPKGKPAGKPKGGKPEPKKPAPRGKAPAKGAHSGHAVSAMFAAAEKAEEGAEKGDAGESLFMPRQTDWIKDNKTQQKVTSGNDAACVAIMTGNKILMGKRRDSGRWTLPGGHLNDGEQPTQAALREVQEETGMWLRPDHLDDMGPSTVIKPNGDAVTVNKYRILLPGPKPMTTRMDPDNEVEKWQWIDTTNGLPDIVKENLHHQPNVVLDALGLR